MTEYTINAQGIRFYIEKPLPRLSWNMSHDGVAEVSATDDEGRVFPVLDIFRQPLMARGGMSKDEAKEFQVFAAERICKAWNADESAAEIAESYKIDPALGGDAGLTDWGRGFNAACDQIAHEFRRRVKL